MSSKLIRWLTLWLVCGAVLIQFTGCAGILVDLPLRILAMLVLDQVLGPLLGDPAGDISPDLGNLFDCFTGGTGDG